MTRQTAKLFWIAGASTAGKTTILPLLKLKLPSEQFAVHAAKRYRKEGTQYQVKVFNTSRTTPARAGRKIFRWITSAMLE